MIDDIVRIYSQTLFASPFFYSVYFSFVAGSGFVVAGLKEHYVSAILFLLLLAFLFEAFTADIGELESVYLIPIYLVSFLFGFSRKRGYLPFFDQSILWAPFSLFGNWLKRLLQMMSFKGAEKPSDEKKRNSRCQGRAEQQKRSTDDSAAKSRQREQKAREDFANSRKERVKREQTKEKASGEVREEQIDTRTPLEIMGLHEGYSQDELKKAYKILYSRYHPDKFVHMKPEIIKAMKEEFQVVQKAYAKLKQ